MEAYAIVVDLTSQAHNYGESIADKIEFWVSISSGLIVMAYFAPERLNSTIAGLIILTYVTFSLFIITNIAADGRLGDAALQDAQAIAMAHNLDSTTLTERLHEARGSTVAVLVFMATLFIGTIGYVAHTAYQTHRGGKKGAN